MTDFLIKLSRLSEAEVMLKRAIELAPLKVEKQTLKNRYQK